MVVAATTVLLFSKSKCVIADGDVEFWQSAIACFDINPDWAVAVEEHVKMGHVAGNVYYHHTDLGFVYKSFAEGIDLGFNFKQVFKKDDDGHWCRENRPHLNVTFKGWLGPLDFADRSRMEFRDRECDEDLWRYTHRLKVKLPYEFTRFKFRPYVADQVYLNLEGQTFEKNRIYAGIMFELSKNLESEFCYVWQSAKPDGQWEDLNALGILLRIRF